MGTRKENIMEVGKVSREERGDPPYYLISKQRVWMLSLSNALTN